MLLSQKLWSVEGGMDAENKWIGLDSSVFRFEDLGRAAVFLLPVKKLDMSMGEGTVRDELHAYLMRSFDSFTRFEVPHLGVWVSNARVVCHDTCVRYEVSFVGKDRITELAEFLAGIAVHIDEACIYFMSGQYAALIYPKK